MVPRKCYKGDKGFKCDPITKKNSATRDFNEYLLFNVNTRHEGPGPIRYFLYIGTLKNNFELIIMA